MATKRVTITKSDGSNNSFTFVIPETVGTYSIKFNTDSGQILNAGNIVVDGAVKTYALKFGLSDGSEISAGTFDTPHVQMWRTVWSGSKTLSTRLSGGDGEDSDTQSFTGLVSGRRTKITGSVNCQAQFETLQSLWTIEPTYSPSDSDSFSGDELSSWSRALEASAILTYPTGQEYDLSWRVYYGLSFSGSSAILESQGQGIEAPNDEIGSIAMSAPVNATCSFTITKIEQYY